MTVKIALACLIVWNFVVQAFIFKKAGEPVWKAAIPIYNVYLQFKIVSSEGVFWGYVLFSAMWSVINIYAGGASVINMILYAFILILTVIYCRELADTFGHGIPMTLALLFLYPVASAVLAFNGDRFGAKFYNEHKDEEFNLGGKNE